MGHIISFGVGFAYYSQHGSPEPQRNNKLKFPRLVFFIMAFIWKLKSKQNFLVMKTLRFFGMALFAVLMCVNFASCSSEENEVPQKNKKVIVSLGFEGEFEVSESPLSRGAISNDLYIIEVKHSNDGLKKYASGMFDNVDNIKIELIEGEKYCFFAFLIKDGKTKLKNEGDTYGNENLVLTNSFTYSNSESIIDDVDFNALTLADGSSYFFPNVTLFNNVSTCTTRYTAVEDESVTISMERWAFGITFEAVNLIEGSLKMCIDDDSYGKSPTVTLDTENKIKEDIYYYPTIVGSDEMDLNISVIWTKDGQDNVLGTPEITFKKNKMTTIKIIVKKNLENGVSFTIDSSQLEDGSTYNVEDGTATEVQ